MRLRARTDNNQAEIESALRDAFMSTVSLAPIGAGVPDLLCGAPMPCPYCQKKFKQNRLIEIKGESGKLRPEQEEFHRIWGGQIAVARTIDEALRICGVVR
jgi:hypothetical protein